MISPREQNRKIKINKLKNYIKVFDETFGNKEQTSLLPIIKLR